MFIVGIFPSKQVSSVRFSIFCLTMQFIWSVWKKEIYIYIQFFLPISHRYSFFIGQTIEYWSFYAGCTTSFAALYVGQLLNLGFPGPYNALWENRVTSERNEFRIEVMSQSVNNPGLTLLSVQEFFIPISFLQELT